MGYGGDTLVGQALGQTPARKIGISGSALQAESEEECDHRDGHQCAKHEHEREKELAILKIHGACP